MDPRLLRYYERELQYVREMGAEYAKEFPKIAARLSLDGLECQDPYVERLLEGFAFLAARVQLKLDAEFPRFTQHLLEILCPHYLAPTPSMAVVQITPTPGDGGLATGYKVPRGSGMKSPRGKGDEAPCEYRTAHEVVLWPIEVVEASHAPYSRELGGGDAAELRQVRGAVRIRLKATAGLTFDKIAVDALPFFLRGAGDVPARLWEQIVGGTAGVLVRPAGGGATWREMLPATAVRRVGFDPDEALLPFGPRSFQGYRLLHEYFAFPERYLFFEIAGFSAALAGRKEKEIEIAILLSRSDATLHNVVDGANFALHCTPVVNLFPMQADTIQLSDTRHEYHVVPDRSRPMDFEVHDVIEVEGKGGLDQAARRLAPFYASPESATRHPDGAFYTTLRQPRLLAESQRRKGTRSSYVGSEVFLSLVDAKDVPYSPDLKQLSVKVRCTNRDLPLHLTTGQGRTDFSLQSGGPVQSVRCVAGPTAPAPSFVQDPSSAGRAGEVAWRLVSHMSLNYLSIVDAPDGRGADNLREMLALYAPVAAAAVRKQIDGLRSVRSRPVIRRIHGSGPLAFGRGLEITVTFDESAFVGASSFLLGAVLDEFFARYVSINSFTETVVETLDRGELIRWPARTGRRHAL